VSSDAESGLFRVGDGLTCPSSTAVVTAATSLLGAVFTLSASGEFSAEPETAVDDGGYFRTGTGGGTRFPQALAEEVDGPWAAAFDFKCSVVSTASTDAAVVTWADVSVSALDVVILRSVDNRSPELEVGSGSGRFFDSLLLRVSVSLCETALARRFSLGGDDLTSASVDTGSEAGRCSSSMCDADDAPNVPLSAVNSTRLHQTSSRDTISDLSMLSNDADVFDDVMRTTLSTTAAGRSPPTTPSDNGLSVADDAVVVVTAPGSAAGCAAEV